MVYTSLTQPGWNPYKVNKMSTRNLEVKSKMLPWSGCSLEAVEPHPQKGAIKFF